MTIAASKGYNQFRWNLIVKKEKSMKPYFIHYDRFIEKGTYFLLLKSGEQEYIQELEVLDP